MGKQGCFDERRSKMLTINQSTGEIFLYGAVGASWFEDSFTSMEVIEALAKIGNKRATVRINSPGGVVTSGMSIFDTMNYIKPDVCTICVGQAASMGAFLLSAGKKGKRFSLPNSRIMIHQPLGGAQGQATDIQIQAKEIQRIKDSLNHHLAAHTGQDIKTIELDTDRDNFMSAEEACAYGLVDKVIEHHE